jgi:hypothetical protein
MIRLVMTAAHRDTHEEFRSTSRIDLRTTTYHRLFTGARIPRATYVFTDMDRLGPWELELAGRLGTELALHGIRILNHPARVRQRFSLLRTLFAAGRNDFNVWRAEDPIPPDHFPVFLRLESGHRGPLDHNLLHTPDDVARAVEKALATGYPLRELILVGYCAEEAQPGVFRKYGMYRIGDRLIPALSVHESRWMVKHGELGLAGPTYYREEKQQALIGSDTDALRPCFELGEIEYGRADYGKVGPRIQVYEINTNPMISRTMTHPFPDRLDTDATIWQATLEAWAMVDSEPGPSITLCDPVLCQQRKRDRFMTVSRWVH